MKSQFCSAQLHHYQAKYISLQNNDCQIVISTR